MLESGLYDVPPGKVAAVVTHLEMRAPALPRRSPSSVEIHSVENPQVEWYRALFRAVGGHEWLWFSRLNMEDAALSAIITDPDVEIWTIRHDDTDAALLELDFRQAGACELAFLGVTPALIGTGAGRALMNHAIARAFTRPIARFHVHTCTLDSPAALGFYRRSGFIPIRQQIEIADDPRLTGKLPPDSGPHVPVFTR